MTTDERRGPLIAVIGANETAPNVPSGVRSAPDLRALGAELPIVEIVFTWSQRDQIQAGFSDASRLRWIQTAFAGVDGLLFPALVHSDVVVTNARGVYDIAMAEATIGFVLALSLGLRADDRRGWGVRDHLPRKLLAGSNMLVVGAGSAGGAVGRAAKALGICVVGVGRHGRPGDASFDRVAPISELAELLGDADTVVDVLPLTPETHHLFGRTAFEAMQESALFINVGRGRTVDEAALIRALRMGEIAGAALDVFEVEPLPPTSPLWKMEHVIVSPHVSGNTEGWQQAVVQLFEKNLMRYRLAEPLLNIVDKRLGYVPSEIAD